MSSLRNSLHRRNHKERSQLSSRKRLGILEKHKDYVQRAKDFNQKKEKIKRLKQKVADRNKDEFYFGMVGKHTKNGIHYQDRGQVSLPIDLVNVLKSQDEGYLRTTKTANLKVKRMDHIKSEISKIVANPHLGADLDEESIQLLEEVGLFASSSAKKKRNVKHIVFVENESAANEYLPPQESPVLHTTPDDMGEDDLGWKSSPKVKLEKANPRGGDIRDAKDVVKTQKGTLEDLLPELRARLQRDTHLRYALRELEMQRALMGKGASKKIRAAELIKPDGVEDDELTEDEQDALFGKRRKVQPKR